MDDSAPASRLARRHLVFGWWTILAFLTLGIALESLHGFKVGWYLNVANETRRLMWTLAHAHGVLLGLVNVALGLTLHVLHLADTRSLRNASRALVAASLLIPVGFLLGGVLIHGGDPGAGVLMVPIGALLLLAAALSIALGVQRHRGRSELVDAAREGVGGDLAGRATGSADLLADEKE